MRDDLGMEQVQAEDSPSQFDGRGQAVRAPGALPCDGKAAERPMSWKIEVVVDDSGEWESDPFRFGTLDEALAYARDLEFRWAAVRDRRVLKSQDPVNQSWPLSRTP